MSPTLVPSKPVLQPSNFQPQSGQHTDALQTKKSSGQENPWHPRRDASGKLFYPLTDTNKFVFDLETEQEEGRSQKRDIRRYLRQVQSIGPLIEQTTEVDELPDPDEACSIGPSESGSQITPSPNQYQYTTIEDEESSDYEGILDYVDYERNTMSKISSVSAGNGTATIYADVLKACDVVKLPTFVSGLLDNPFTPERLLNEVPSISANHEAIKDRVDAFIEAYEPKHTLGEDDICLVVRLVTAAALVDDYANKETDLEPLNTQHQRLSRTGVWNVGPLHTTTLAKQPGSPFAKISAPDPDLAITLPGTDHTTSLEAAIAEVYSKADIPADALKMLSGAICQELLDYEEIKDVIFVCKTDARETPFGNFMIVPFENKATPAGAEVALNQILNCLFFLVVKLYDMQKLALALYSRLEENDNVPIGMSRPAFNPAIKLYGVRVCGSSWNIDGLQLDLTEKLSAAWYDHAQGTLDDEAGRKNFMAAIKIAYRCNLTLIVPTIIEAHRFFLLYANHAKLLRRRSIRITERLHKQKPSTIFGRSQPSSTRQSLAKQPALSALIEHDDTKATLPEHPEQLAGLTEQMRKAKIAQED